MVSRGYSGDKGMTTRLVAKTLITPTLSRPLPHLEVPPPKTLTPAPLPTTPSAAPGEGYPWGFPALLPLLPVKGAGRGREKRAGVMRVLGGGALSSSAFVGPYSANSRIISVHIFPGTS
jgi:hypothetical protein